MTKWKWQNIMLVLEANQLIVKLHLQLCRLNLLLGFLLPFWIAKLIFVVVSVSQRGGSKSNFFVLPSNTPYGLRPGSELQQADYTDSSPRRLTTIQTIRGANIRGSPHPYRANRGEGQRSRCHTPDNLLNSEGAVCSRPQSIHDVPHSSNPGSVI